MPQTREQSESGEQQRGYTDDHLNAGRWRLLPKRRGGRIIDVRIGNAHVRTITALRSTNKGSPPEPFNRPTGRLAAIVRNLIADMPSAVAYTIPDSSRRKHEFIAVVFGFGVAAGNGTVGSRGTDHRAVDAAEPQAVPPVLRFTMKSLSGRDVSLCSIRGRCC